MSDNRFKLISQEVASEVLEAASNNADAVEHLVDLCGCATFRYGEGLYLILTPPIGGLIYDSHVIQIIDSMVIQEIGDQVVCCGNSLRKPLGSFLKEAGMEDSNMFRTLVSLVEKSMRKRGIEGPIDAHYFDARTSEDDEEAAGIPEEVSAAITSWFENDPMVMTFEVKRTPTGIEIGVGRLNPLSTLGILGDLLQALGGNGFEGDLLQALGGNRLPQNEPEGLDDFEAFLKAQGFDLDGADFADDDSDWLSSLDDTDLNFGPAFGEEEE